MEKQYVVEAISRDSWRLFKILAEFVDGFEALSDIGPCVSIFGSARVQLGDEIYERTVAIARKLAQNGYSVMTGGGPGLMEAGNKGAREGGAKSIGLNIKLFSFDSVNNLFYSVIVKHWFSTIKNQKGIWIFFDEF